MCSEDPYQQRWSFETASHVEGAAEYFNKIFIEPKCFYEGEKCPNCNVGELELIEDELLGDKFVCTICRHSVKR